MTTFVTEYKNLNIGNSKVVIRFHEGRYSTEDEREIVFLRKMASSPEYKLTEILKSSAALKSTVTPASRKKQV